MVQAIVSVMAVKIQFSSPLGVLRSLSLPGMFSARSGLTSPREWGFCKINHLKKIGRGVVRHAVNISAGYRGLSGRISFELQAARTMFPPSMDA